MPKITVTFETQPDGSLKAWSDGDAVGETHDEDRANCIRQVNRQLERLFFEPNAQRASHRRAMLRNIRSMILRLSDCEEEYFEGVDVGAICDELAGDVEAMRKRLMPPPELPFAGREAEGTE